MAARITVQAFFDDKTFTVSYVIVDNASHCAAIVDPVLDFDFKSGRTSTVQADRLLAYVREHGLTVQWILETHAHADHLSSARYLQERVGGRIANVAVSAWQDDPGRTIAAAHMNLAITPPAEK